MCHSPPNEKCHPNPSCSAWRMAAAKFLVSSVLAFRTLKSLFATRTLTSRIIQLKNKESLGTQKFLTLHGQGVYHPQTASSKVLGLSFFAQRSGLIWAEVTITELFLAGLRCTDGCLQPCQRIHQKKKKKKKKNLFLTFWCIGICPTKFCNERRCEVLIADNKLIFYGTSRCARHEVAHPFFSQTNKQDSYLQFSNIHCTCPKPEISETSMFEASENARWQNIGADDCIPSRCQGTCSLFPTSEGLRNFCFVIGHRGWVTDHTPIHSGSTSHSIFTSWQQDPDDT